MQSPSIFPFPCPNEKCSYQFSEFPSRDKDNAVTCPVCGDRFWPRVEFTVDEQLLDSFPEIIDDLKSDIRRQVGEP